MIFLAVLAVATAAAAVVLSGRGRSARDIARIGMATAMAVAGVAHWVAPAPFLQHLPPWVPWAEALILLTGFAEVGLGAALLIGRRVRRYAGLALAGYLVLVFPSNVYVAVAGIDVDGQPGGWYPWLRLPLQLLFVMWALWSTRPDAGIDQTGTSAPALPAVSLASPEDWDRTSPETDRCIGLGRRSMSYLTAIGYSPGEGGPRQSGR